jgi:hypothetical protein
MSPSRHRHPQRSFILLAHDKYPQVKDKRACHWIFLVADSC